MIKLHSFLSALLLLVSFAMSGCSSSDEPSTDENSLAGRAVTFSAETSLSKKIAYGTANGASIPIYWSANDLIATYSPQSTTTSKSAVYKADNGEIDHTPFSLNTGETALTWNAASVAQSFCSFFPSTAATFSGDEGSIQAIATLPSAQDGSVNNNFMAGFKHTATDPVDLQFAPLMNVLRLTITDAALNTDAAHTVSAIVIKSKETPLKKLAGTFKVGYPSSSENSLSASSFTCDVNSATSDSILITGSALSAVTSGALTVSAYLLPQNYGSLKITVYTNTNKSYLSKTAFSSTPFAQSSMFDLSFGDLTGLADVPATVYGTVDLGCPAGGSGTTPVYFAESNLVVEKTESGVKGYLAATPWYRAPETTANYTSDAVGTKRDLFGWGDITGWKTSTSSSDYPSPTTYTNISGNASYDIARALLGGNWRLITYAEMYWMNINCNTTWTTNYNGSGIAGTIITGSSKTSATYDGKDHSGATLFLPGAGYRNGTSLTDSQNYCDYWLGTSNGSSSYFISAQSAIHISVVPAIYGMSIRPVTE